MYRIPAVGIVFCLLVSAGLLAPGSATAAEPQLILDTPSLVARDRATAITVRLPPRIAAVEGRLLIDPGAAEVIGVAPKGGGIAFRPIAVEGGAAFGAYGLRAVRGLTTLRLVLVSEVSDALQVRVVIDSAADAAGRRIAVPAGRATTLGRVDRGRIIAAPDVGPWPSAVLTSERVREAQADGRFDEQDLDAVTGGWQEAREADVVCGSRLESDVNGDGCVDIIDVQATLAAQGELTDAPGPTAVGDRTWVVLSTADTPDANPGNGICADSMGRCTLRAAMMEANWMSGDDRIEFELTGAAPVVIQLGSVLPTISSRAGTLDIDGYSQPGRRVNTTTVGSNAIQGIELRGPGLAARQSAIRITSDGNIIRGFVINESYFGVFLDGAGAGANRIIGNWIGYRRDGTFAPRPYQAVTLNNGAHDNMVGTGNLADRNLLFANHAIESFGPGTNRNVLQNNVLCLTANGMGGSRCQVGIDHNHGPKDSVIGGTGPNERNIIGPTNNQAIEFSHGWQPGDKTQGGLTYQINGHLVIGNWLGFRGDGSYHVDFRSGMVPVQGTSDNGNAVNVYDGSNDNVIEGNWMASRWDGIQFMMGNALRKTARGNFIGRSPTGQAAPIPGWGIKVRIATRDHLIEDNTISNTGLGGIGLLESNVGNVRISRNIVTDTAGPAIDLYGIPGPDLNDPGDGDSGANTLLNTPIITSAGTSAVSGTGLNGATIEVFRASRTAGALGLPAEFLGSVVVGSGGAWSVPVAGAGLELGDRVTALQIRTNDDTSELSANVVVSPGGPPPPDPPVASFGHVQQPDSLTVDFSDTSSGSPTTWSWDLGDGNSSSLQHPSHSYAVAGEYTVVLTVSSAGGADDESQLITVVAPPPPDPALARDTFTRSITGGWGTTDVGTDWTTTGPTANFEVSGTSGLMRLPSGGANRAAVLREVSAQEVDLRVRFSLDKLPAGGSTWIYGLVRQTGTSSVDGYRPKLRIDANGSVWAHAGRVIANNETALGPAVRVTGLDLTPGGFIWLRAAVTGSAPTTITLKAWADGQAEPLDWHFSATDATTALQGPGAVGLRAYLAASVSNGPLLASFDDLTVTTPGGPPPP